MIISAMVVVANNDVIGEDNDILWEIPRNWAHWICWICITI